MHRVWEDCRLNERPLTFRLMTRRGMTRDREISGSQGPGPVDANEASHDAPIMVYADPASHALTRLLARIAPSDVPVTISGEAGTGKEAIARYIHQISGRTGPFACVNCSAIADQLAAEGAAARVRSERWFEAARHGTLFLDEIADLPAGAQNQLLRVLQEQEAARGGIRDPKPADVRLVAATPIELGDAVAAGHFRLELFYRLNVGQVRLLPLRERRGDISPLAHHFLRMYSTRLNLSLPVPGQDVLTALERHSWPGNVRELENVIRFALLVAPERDLRIEHLKLGGAQATAPGPAVTPAAALYGPESAEETSPRAFSQWLAARFQAPGVALLSNLEHQIVAEAFRFTGQNQVRTAAVLGISRNVLRTLLRKHGLLCVRGRKGRMGGAAP